MRMVNLKRAKADKEKSEPTASEIINAVRPEDEGVSVHLDHHHLMKLKGSDGEPIGGQMKSGHKVSFSGEGTVEHSETRSGKDGDRHSATIRLHKGALEHEAGTDEQRSELRGEIEKNAGAEYK